RRSEERFRLLSAASPVGIFEMDAAGGCTYVNHRWEQISGLGFDASRGGGWLEALHPDDRPGVAARWSAAVERGESFSEGFRIRTTDGTERWASFRAAPSTNEAGERLGFVSSVEDITRQKQAEAELIRARESALDMARLKSEFVANMSHEIR